MRKNALAPILVLAAAAVILGAPGCAKKPAPADLVLLDGDVYTVDPAQPTARAIVINGNMITAVCASDRQARRYIGPKTRVFDFLGKFVLPGLIDARVRFEAAGAVLCDANLLKVSDEAGIRKEIQRVVDQLDDGEWITDGLWGASEPGAAGDRAGESKENKASWRPNRRMIDDLTANHPCFLCRFDRKEWLANGAALAEAGLDKARLPGMEIGPDGQATGIVFPATPAYDKLKKAVKPKSEMRLLDESRTALQALREAGITEIHDVETPEQTKRFVELEKSGVLTCRVWILPDPARAAELKAQGFAMGLHPATKQKSSMLRYGPLGGEVDASRAAREARPSFGSDWPGTGADASVPRPVDLIHAAVTRAPSGGKPGGGGIPEGKISVADAIRAYTINNAYAAYEDDLRGSLRAGKLADITVFDRNLLKIAPAEILEAKVTHTIVDGKIVFRRRAPAPAKRSR
jgi:predicted amidohydrolase YtcJ